MTSPICPRERQIHTIMRATWLCAFSALLLWAKPLTAADPTPAPAPAPAPTYDLTWRFPVIAIPRLPTPPVIDGKVDPKEWAQATLFPPLFSRDPLEGDGFPPDERTWIWMAYTPDGIYWAVRQDLPNGELPVQANGAKRDSFEGRDNSVNILFSPDVKAFGEQFNFSVNALGQTFDRRFDDGSGHHWDPDVQCQATQDSRGWEAELFIPFKELGLSEAPKDGAAWSAYFYSAWRKSGNRLFAWPYVGWRSKQSGQITFGGPGAGVRFEKSGQIATVAAEGTKVQTQLLHRPLTTTDIPYLPGVSSAIAVGQVEGGTLQSLDQIVGSLVSAFKPTEQTSAIGEYLFRYDVTRGDQVLARGVEAFYVSPPLDIVLRPYLLRAKKLQVTARTTLPQAASVRVKLDPAGSGTTATFPLNNRRGQVYLSTADLKPGPYAVSCDALDAAGATVTSTKVALEIPGAPDWWTMNAGREPKIPPPWTPVEASSTGVKVLLREYDLGAGAMPSRIQTRGVNILAGPIEFQSASPWQAQPPQLISQEEDAATYRAVLTRDQMTATITNRIEFDGFMLVDVELAGTGTLDKLDLAIPFKQEHAILLQNYAPAPGPGSEGFKRFHGDIPKEGYQSPPMLTTWLGTDHYGLEISFESSKGWSMAKPVEAMQVTRAGDQVVLRVGFISKAVQLTADKPRRIRFGLVATPTKTLLPYIQKTRFYDDVHVALLPFDWAGFPAWHPPVKDAAVIEKTKKWVDSVHARGAKLLVNGGWSVSVQDPNNAPFIYEMMAEPMSNVSYSTAKQYAFYWDSPFAEFLVNSFAYNAKTLGFDGIRFDTVTPGYPCNGDLNGGGWVGDNGVRYGTTPLFAQREAWKRLYRIFHGGVIKEGVVYTPNAAGPLMAIHSFSDHHEIGEGFYQSAKTLKEGYLPGLIRTTMAGDQYGLVTGSNLKDGPLYFNERIAALLVNGAEPRFLDSRNWRPGYEAQGCPAISIWDAWDWVDRYNAKWLGWWENAKLFSVSDGAAAEDMVLGSFYHNPLSKRVLLVVTNYEKKPLPGLKVKLNVAELGLAGPLHAEDAVTYEPLAIAADGTMALPVFGQRYRLVKISAEAPRYREESLGSNLVTNVPAELSQNWQSSPVAVEANTQYVITAEVKIAEYMGTKAKTPNQMGRFSPAIVHYVTVGLTGAGVTGVAGSNRRAGDKPYDQEDVYLRSFQPQWWEPTGDWARVHLVVRTRDAGQGQVALTVTDPGEASVRNITLRKVQK